MVFPKTYKKAYDLWTQILLQPTLWTISRLHALDNDLQPASVVDDVSVRSRDFGKRVLLLRDASFRRLRIFRVRETSHTDHAKAKTRHFT